MVKGFITVFFLLVCNYGFAQKKTFTEAEKATLDSILKDDEFFNMVKAALKPESYFLVSAGLGNSYFSFKNKGIAASQMENKLVFTPGVDYFHKSGLGLSAEAFLFSFNGKSNFYQFSLTPSYRLLNNKSVGATVSYTRFFRRAGYEDAASPFQNDLYASAYLKKPWVEPGIAMGFSGGKKTEYHKIDTVLFAVRRIFTDTVKTTIKAFSISAFVQHSFIFLDILKKDDGISIEPRLMLNAGLNKYTEKHYNPYSAFFKKILQRRKDLGRLQDNTSFELQSVACSIDINYLIGKFGFEPQIYMDYYLPSTTEKKFTSVYSFAISYSF